MQEALPLVGVYSVSTDQWFFTIESTLELVAELAEYGFLRPDHSHSGSESCVTLGNSIFKSFIDAFNRYTCRVIA